ncbi:hypothetical protein [Thioalkalivibrio sp.]|uniref:hypothetical protein n=1 Tax=Thioalkalivibrio sp. TaxID=2093813 RepID=UPI003976905A
MFTSASNIEELIRSFRIEEAMMRYSSFVPRLYNYCRSLGFEPGRMLPSRAFCSDESQGYPTILIAKHFGTFPFNHGRGGAIVATQRHGPFAEHGQDLVIIQASHVGYDPDNAQFGTYRRIHAAHAECTANCGKIAGVVSRYLREYRFAQAGVLLERCAGVLCVRIDNGLLRGNRSEGLFLNLNRLIERDVDGDFTPLRTYSTSKSFTASSALQQQVADLALEEGQRVAIGSRLRPEMFFYQRELDQEPESRDQQEGGLITAMPWIVTSASPLLTAAQINTQVEFDRAFRTAAQAPCFRGKRLLHIAGLNIDISPQPGEVFPTTHFVPWAAYARDKEGSQRILEQAELVALLREQDTENPDQVDLEAAISAMAGTGRVHIDSGPA